MGCFLFGGRRKQSQRPVSSELSKLMFLHGNHIVPGCSGPWSAVALASRALLTPSTYCCTLDRGLASEFSFLAALQRSEADALRLR